MANSQRLVAGGIVAASIVAVVILASRCGSGTEEPAESPAPTAAPAPAPAAPAEQPNDDQPAVPQPPPNREVALPTVEPAVPGERTKVPHPTELTDELAAARAVLEKLVRDHGRDPENPWAVTHSMLALGPDVALSNGKNAVDHLFATYAETVDVGTEGPGDDHGISFPKSKGTIRIEPHTDLVLKALTEGGVSPDREVTVHDEKGKVLDLYRASMHRVWVAGSPGRYQTSLGSMNNTPWALQALSAWAPKGYGWTAIGNKAMTMDAFAEADLIELEKASSALMAAKGRGAMPKKDGKGILSYSCGGHHLVQGVAHAVARGFGPDDAKPRACAQRDLIRWRIDHELGSIDPLFVDERVTKDPGMQVLLLIQRLKFVGHAMETLSKFDAYGYCTWTDEDTKAQERLVVELIRTVKALQAAKVFDDPQAIRNDRSLDRFHPNSGGAEQVYLDLIGDSAHAIRGIDLATGEATVGF